MSENSSLSKKWRLAVKNNLFQGSFKDFADQYNSTFNEEEFYSDAADSLGMKNTAIDSSQINPSDLKPIDKSKVDEFKILGMTKGVFGFVLIGVVALTGFGIYQYMKKPNNQG